MKKTAILAAVFGVAMIATSAVAATLDFVGYANSGEHGVASGTSITSPFFGGETVKFTAGDSYNPYFDAASLKGDAGLGVCKVLSRRDLCDPASDDNVTVSEWVGITFTGLRNLSNILLRADGHVPLADTVSLVFGINADAWTSITYGDLKTMSFEGVKTAYFAFDNGTYGTTPKPPVGQFYVQSVVVSPVPLPAAGFMLLTALGGLAAARRRKSA